MGIIVPPPVKVFHTCKKCKYFQQKWKSEWSDWSYCDYWHKDTREGSSCCDKFEENHSNVEKK